MPGTGPNICRAAPRRDEVCGETTVRFESMGDAAE
jgi:hypothetical protein